MNKERTRKKAVAVAYDHIGAPRVIAKGNGLIAERMVEIAEEKNIPIQKNETLMEALMQIELTKEIPPELYQAVAEVLAFIFKLDKSKGIEEID